MMTSIINSITFPTACVLNVYASSIVVETKSLRIGCVIGSSINLCKEYTHLHLCVNVSLNYRHLYHRHSSQYDGYH